MDWIAKLEQCSIDLRYLAADGASVPLSYQLRLIAMILAIIVAEAREEEG